MRTHSTRATAARALTGTVVALTAVLAGAAPAYAPHVAQLQVTPAVVAAGEQVTVYGPRGYGSTNPVSIRLGRADGPVLATFTPNNERFAQFGPGPVTIPADTPPGVHQLVATQDLAADEQHIRGVPSMAQVEVRAGSSGAAGLPPLQTESRPDGLARDAGVPVGLLVLVAAGVGAVALGLGFAVAGSNRRRAAPATAPVEK